MRISDWSSDVCSSDLVRQLVRAAAAQGVPIVGYGAGTSLEGNAAAVTSDTLVVDFSRMNEIVEISPEDLLVVVQPGVTREQLNEELRTTGVFFPVDPGAIATIGGKIAPRASGTTTVRYGNMRDKNGKASCRERVGQYVKISVVGV